MNIDNICASVKSCLAILKDARTGKAIDHSQVEEFQENLKNELNKVNNGYKWEIEKKAKGRSEKDSIDILGQSKGNPDWIIEIDATRSDQVSKKLLSRLALWGLKSPIQYVAILYPDTQKGKKSCEKFLRYGSVILDKINKCSSVIGIFVNQSTGDIEVQRYKPGRYSDHFYVEGNECKSMGDAAARAIKVYLSKHSVSYDQLKECWGVFVSDCKGSSRYKNINVQTSDEKTVYTFTQFRQYGICSYWAEFEKLCKKKGISITKMRKLYIGGSSLYEYQV